ncbi:substance-K receptor-like [Ptychodera flava]|uniref:substance-K receptor-like n=1 Tax=Ptychodera flava TaxID=63121 RepID=UPI00396A1D98
MEMTTNLNQTIVTTPPDILWQRIHAHIIEYMLNRSAKEGRYWEKSYDSVQTSERSLLDSEADGSELEVEWRTALIFAFSCNITLSVIGNVIVLLVLSFGKSKTDLNIFLINLALADLTMAVFCMPFTFPTIMYGHWIFGSAMCPAVIFLQQVSVIVSIFTLTAIGIDRYFAVMYPLKARVTKHRSKIVLAVIFLIAVSLAVVQAVFARVRQSRSREGIYYCNEWPNNNHAFIAYEIFIFLTTYCIPLVVLLYTYTRIGIKLWGRRIPGNAHNFRDKSHVNSKKKIVKMLIVVVLMFAICWLPLHVFNLVVKFRSSVYDEDSYARDTIRKINACVLWLAMSNSFMNSVIYSLFNEGFRADMLVVSRNCLQCHCKNVSTLLIKSSTTGTRERSTSSTSTSLLTTSKFSSVLISKFRRSSENNNGSEKREDIKQEMECKASTKLCEDAKSCTANEV